MNDEIAKNYEKTENKNSVNGTIKEETATSLEKEENVANEESDHPKKNKETDDNRAAKENKKNDWYFPPSIGILEKCLTDSFSEERKSDLISIIEIHIKDFARTISYNEHVDIIIIKLIRYCTDQSNFDGLWKGIKEKREKRYDEFFDVWKDSYKKEREDKGNEELTIQQNKRIKGEQKNQTDEDDITKWFFDKLGYVEQSMVITAALFQGIERSVFNELTQYIQNKLLFPPEQEVSRSEPPSEENQEGTEQQKEKQTPPQLPRLKNELEQFHLAKLTFISDKRNSDYGLTDIEIVIFEFNNYQTEVLKLIKNNLYSKQSDLFGFISTLVNDKSAEKRLFAVKAVIALSETHIFQDLLDHIIRKWAKTENYYTHQATALSLSGILLQGRLEKEILALLNSWLKTGTSMFLNITSMFTYYLIAETYPDQALQAVAHVSEKEDIIFSLSRGDIAFKVYQKDLSTFISYLYNWIKDDKPLLRQQAGIYFFRFIDIADAVTDTSIKEKAVAIIFNLWEKSNIPMHPEVQGEITSKIESWAEKALVAWENDDLDSFESYCKLFHGLYKKYEEECQKNKICRVNRLEYHLQRWEKRRVWELKRAEGKGVSNNKQSNFNMLRPKLA